MKPGLKDASVWRSAASLALCTSFALGWVGCAADVDLAAVPEAVVGCAAPTPDELVPEAPMLPGRQCIACHNPTGQASRRVWTAAGTVFDSITADCNSAGVDNATVELLDAASGQLLITLTTNRTGNFFTAEPIPFAGITARISKGGLSAMMTIPAPSGNCPSCHHPGGLAGGRIYLN